MTENDVKLLLKSMKKLKARREILKCLKKTGDEFEHICRVLHVLENSLDILSDSEKEIIQMHLIEGYTWEQVIAQYEECHGKQNGYSRRTYERIQQKSIKQILDVINDSEIERMLPRDSVPC